MNFAAEHDGKKTVYLNWIASNFEKLPWQGILIVSTNDD